MTLVQDVLNCFFSCTGVSFTHVNIYNCATMLQWSPVLNPKEEWMNSGKAETYKYNGFYSSLGNFIVDWVKKIYNVCIFYALRSDLTCMITYVIDLCHDLYIRNRACMYIMFQLIYGFLCTGGHLELRCFTLFQNLRYIVARKAFSKYMTDMVRG